MFIKVFEKNDRESHDQKELVLMSKNKNVQTKSTLSTTQEVLYAKEFKQADRAGGYTHSRRK